jgi:aminoglycoside phosphotransferase family enzyme
MSQVRRVLTEAEVKLNQEHAERICRDIRAFSGRVDIWITVDSGVIVPGFPATSEDDQQGQT